MSCYLKKITYVFLRGSKDRVWSQLLLAEAKRCGMTIELPLSSKHGQALVMPEIPTNILQLYKILMNTFYTQENRKYDKSIQEQVAQSIHWIFINPLIIENEQLDTIDASLYSNLLKVPGKYTQLLIDSNIVSKIIRQGVDGTVLPNAENTTRLNDIIAVFKANVIDILIDELQENADKKLNTVIKQDMITNTIQPVLDTKTIWHLLYNKQHIITDIISLLHTIYSQDQSKITLQLLSLMHHIDNNSNIKTTNHDDLITTQDISKQVVCKSDNEVIIQQDTNKHCMYI